MRLHRLDITGIGPFKDHQVVDFDEVSSSGLFLVEGPTGSGKTTLIDAIVYAMFGVVSSGSDDATRMRIRSHYCGEADPTGVTCEFSVDGRRWRVTRIPAGCRDPREPGKPARSKGPRQSLVEVAADGSDGAVLSTRADVDDGIEELLGMTVDQFRQLVVLPQGQFAELLRQTPAERLRSLEPLLEDGLIARIQADLEQAGRDARVRRDAADLTVDQAAQQLAGRLSAWLEAMPSDTSFLDPRASDEGRRDVVEGILAALDRQIEHSVRARDEQETLARDLRERAQRTEDLRTSVVGIAEARQAADAARADTAPEDDDVTESSVGDRVTALNRLAGALAIHAEWEGAVSRRGAERSTLVERAARLRAGAQAARDERAALPATRSALEEQRAVAQRRSGGLAAAEREVERLSDLAGRISDLAGLRVREADLSAAVREAEAVAAQARADADAADASWRALAARQHADAASALAAGLTAGSACPVCGSTEHPDPAAPEHGTAPVTAPEVDHARVAAEAARHDADTAASAVITAHTAHGAAVAETAGLAGALGDLDGESLAAALAAATSERDAAASAVRDAEALTARIAELAEQERLLTDSIGASESEAASIEATVAANDALEAARDAEVRAAIGTAESATALQESVRSRIDALTRLQRAWGALTAATAALPEDARDMDIEVAARSAEEAVTARDAAESHLAQLSELAATATSTRDEAAPLAAAFANALDDRREVQLTTATPIELATLVSAGNARHLQLRSYALQRRFASVLAAASHHLERMSAGKFSFELSEAAAKAGQSGLGISLLDSWTGQPQDPKSLSGGETFYASLALALGLADVVRGEAGGSALETLFVDEGFGSLDQDTLNQVLEQLDALRAGNRVVGVVSHVTEMKESIPDRVEVRRQPDSTSTIHRPSA